MKLFREKHPLQIECRSLQKAAVAPGYRAVSFFVAVVGVVQLLSSI